jgi:hypothetical protein
MPNYDDLRYHLERTGSFVDQSGAKLHPTDKETFFTAVRDHAERARAAQAETNERHGVPERQT